MFRAPGIQPADGRAQLGEGFAGGLILRKTLVTRVTLEVFAQTVLVREIAYLLHGSLFIQPAAEHLIGQLFPIILVLGRVLSGDFSARPTVQLKNEAVRHEAGIHPVQRETFLDEKLTSGIVIEDFFRYQSVDFHDGD